MDEKDIQSGETVQPEAAVQAENVSKDLSEIMSKHGIKKYVLIVDNGESNITFYNTDMHYYDAAKMVTGISREFKARIAKELFGEATTEDK